jgi:hypothetical protein
MDEATRREEFYYQKKRIIVTVCFCFSGLFLTAQESWISLKTAQQKSLFLKENKRIKIRTVAGEKIIANYTIVNNETIMIKKTACRALICVHQ